MDQSTMDGDDRRRAGWKQNPEAVREDIVAVATQEFAAKGLAGARIDEIAARTKTSKRMIYYYFGDKGGLYTTVLEEAYARVRAEEGGRDLEDLAPVEALRDLVEFTFDHHRRHPDFIRLVMIENIHQGAYLNASDVIARVNRPAIERIRTLLERGQSAGLFRRDIDPLALHWLISALSFFAVSNRHTFGKIFGEALFERGEGAALRECAVETVLRYALNDPVRAKGAGLET